MYVLKNYSFEEIFYETVVQSSINATEGKP